MMNINICEACYEKKISRRKFLGSTAAAATVFTIVPRHVLGGAGYTPPSEKLNVAGVGMGGMGADNIAKIAGMEADEYDNLTKTREGENIVALCDVDTEKAAGIFNLFPKAKKYTDFQKMLEKQKDIDAVVVSCQQKWHRLAYFAFFPLIGLTRGVESCYIIRT